MVTLAQRIQELRDEKGLSRLALASSLGFPRQAIEKFETGRQTPSKEQMDKMADFFGVSQFYLKGESNDRTRQENWMDAGWADDDEPVSAPVVRKAPKPAPAKAEGDSGSVFAAMVNSKAFQEMVHNALLDILRSPEGEEIVRRVVRKELDRRR